MLLRTESQVVIEGCPIGISLGCCYVVLYYCQCSSLVIYFYARDGNSDMSSIAGRGLPSCVTPQNLVLAASLIKSAKR